MDRDVPTTEPTPDQVLDEYRRAVRRTLLDDLATWPRTFRDKLGPMVESLCEDFDDARELWSEFHEARARSGDPGRFKEQVCARLRGLRAARRAGHSDDVEFYRRDVLECLWMHGRKRIDRRALRRHVSYGAPDPYAAARFFTGCERAGAALARSARCFLAFLLLVPLSTPSAAAPFFEAGFIG